MFQIRVVLTALVMSTAMLAFACGAGDDPGDGSACPGCGDLPVRARAGTDTDGTEPTNDAAAPRPNGKTDGGTVPQKGADAAATPAGPAAGSVRCGDTACSGATPICCLGFDSSSCVAKSASCSSGLAIRAACDQAADCSAGSVCCIDILQGEARCSARSSCSGGLQYEACAGDADCATGRTCKASSIAAAIRVCK